MQLACWGSALLNALFNAFISYSTEALSPPSKNPVYFIFCVPLVSISYRLYLWVYAILFFWLNCQWDPLHKIKITASIFHHFHQRFSFACKVIKIRSRTRCKDMRGRHVLIGVHYVFLFTWGIVLFVKHCIFMIQNQYISKTPNI